MYADHLVQPWYDRLAADLPDGPVLDVHTHLGDRDSVSATAEELLGAVASARARALVFPLSEPDGRYRAANEACLEMLEEIGDASKVGEFISKVKDKNSGVKLMGFGHRVYKNYDPRAKLMRETCYEVLNATGMGDDPLFKLAMALEKIALEDDYFVQRKLYPNVDFYSGIVQKAIGIPVQLFTAIFALARTVGWIAQLNEMVSDPEYKIGRPRQLFTGATRRSVKPIAQR